MNIPEILPDLDHLDELSPEQLEELVFLECKSNMRRSDELVRAIFRCGISPNVRDEQYLTPLHHAAANGHIFIMKALLQAGAELDAPSLFHGTPLCLSAENDEFNSIRVLLKYGADPNATTWLGDSPLHDAVLSDNPDIVKTLLKYGADPNITNWNCMTPLHAATDQHFFNKQIIHILLESGASKDAKNRFARTAWDLASPDVRYQCPELQP